jgi:hypothetical protein
MMAVAGENSHLKKNILANNRTIEIGAAERPKNPSHKEPRAKAGHVMQRILSFCFSGQVR